MQKGEEKRLISYTEEEIQFNGRGDYGGVSFAILLSGHIVQVSILTEDEERVRLGKGPEDNDQ